MDRKFDTFQFSISIFSFNLQLLPVFWFHFLFSLLIYNLSFSFNLFPLLKIVQHRVKIIIHIRIRWLRILLYSSLFLFSQNTMQLVILTFFFPILSRFKLRKKCGSFLFWLMCYKHIVRVYNTSETNSLFLIFCMHPICLIKCLDNLENEQSSLITPSQLVLFFQKVLVHICCRLDKW